MNANANDGEYIKKPKNIVVRTSDGSTISGKVNLGTKERVSDLFTITENPFIVLFEVEHRSGVSGKVLFINKSHIVWAEPEDD